MTKDKDAEIDALKAEVETLKNHNEVQVGLAKLYQKQRNDERERAEKLREALTNLMEAHRVVFRNSIAMAFRAGNSGFIPAWTEAEQSLLAAKRDEGDV